ncbi:uncharacterized protein DS421_13g401840 [Arachis hypogaea]|nr:uncharacterized protein DS421_13g401840 [Arachis hypogaea]
MAALSSPVSLTHPLSRTQARRCALYRRLALKLVVALCVVSRRLQKQTESASDPLAGGSCGLLASARLVSFLQSVGPWAGFRVCTTFPSSLCPLWLCHLLLPQAHSFTSHARLLPVHSNSKNQTDREERTGLSWCFASFVRLCARCCPAHASEYASALLFSDLV